MPEKYEREIEELLRQMGDLEPKETWKVRARRLWDRAAAGVRVRARSLNGILTPGNMIKISLILLLASFVLRGFVPRFSVYAYLIGLVLLVVGIAAFVLAGRSAPRQTWRGRVIDLPNRYQPWWETAWARWRSLWRRPDRQR